MADITNYIRFIYFIVLYKWMIIYPVAAENHRVHYMEPGLRIPVRCDRFEIFCFRGHSKHIARFFETVLLNINLKSQNFEQYDGSTPEEVSSEYELHHSSWKFSLFSSKSKNITMAAFNNSCIGISCQGEIQETYIAELLVIRVDYWRVLNLCLGILLFMSAYKLSSNPVFYYICGVTLGICAGFLILVYLLTKLLPKRPAVYGILIGGWTVGVYFIQLLWENFRTVMQLYYSHVLAYTAFSGVLSFIICYRFGPVTDPRTRDLIKWTLQIVGLGMVFMSSQYMEASVAVILVVITVHNFPSWWTAKLKAYWKRRFPPKMKMLTEDEYHEQAVRETHKALTDLRGYCSSPECDPWKTVLKLKDPIRFAHFITGNSHLNDAEILAYETESTRSTECYYHEQDDSEDESHDGY
ncbi:nuclear envelope integral membrane protein [Anabrus simplex]|uniref:nuclear envelope integral membrane protein n=1 Tax=Anabrus simplex TaxID=316456 RepID=UPI0034DD5286